MSNTTIIFLITFCIYLLITLAIGLWAARKKANNFHDFTTAGGNLSKFLTAFSIAGSYLSIFVFMGAVGYAYNFGLSSGVLWAIVLVVNIPTMIILGSKVWEVSRGKGFVTPADLLIYKFGESWTIRVLVGIGICIFFTVFHILLQFVGGGLAINIITGGEIPLWLGSGLIAVIVAVYTSVGGLRSVAFTDSLQAILFMVSLVVVGFFVIFSIPGNLGEIFSYASEVKPSILTDTWPSPMMLTTGIMTGLSVMVWPHIFVRYYSSDSKAGIQQGVTLTMFTVILYTIALACIMAFAALKVFPGFSGDPDTISILFINEFVPITLGTILVTGAIAMGMSTADSITLLISSVITRDILQQSPKKFTDKQATWITRSLCFIVIGAAWVISLFPLPMLIDIAIDLAYPGYVLMLPSIVAALWWERATKQGVVWSILIGLLFILLVSIFDITLPMSINVGFAGLVVASIILVIVSLFTQNESSNLDSNIEVEKGV